MNGHQTEKTVAVIGAGIAGIATAIRLRKSGFNVTVYEKNGLPGGRVSRLDRDGYRFDLGATIFLMPSIYREALEGTGIRIEELTRFIPMETLYHLYFDDGTVFDFTTDRTKLNRQLEALEPGSSVRMENYLRRGYRFMELSMKQLLGRNFYRLTQFITLSNARLLIRLRTYLNHMTFVRRYFKHPYLQMAATFQNIYVGQSPYRAPALFAMLPAAELVEGSMAPEGGMNGLFAGLLREAERLGVRVQCDRLVEKILTVGRRANGLRFEDGSEVFADVIVANADLPYVYRDLLPDIRRARRIRRMTHSCSAIVFHWGVDKVYPGLAQHNVFLSDQYRDCLDSIFKRQEMTGEVCFYLHSPVRNDPDAAPPGCDAVSVIVPVAHLDDNDGRDWSLLRQNVRNTVLNRLKKLGWEDIEEHIGFEVCYLPGTWETIFHVSKGSVFGSLGHQVMQMGYFRPHNRHPRYRNLYFAGGSTHPGNGVPLVLMSAKLTGERIIREQANRQN